MIIKSEEKKSRLPAVLAALPDSAVSAEEGQGLRIHRMHTRPGVHPYDEVTWERRTAQISGDDGQVVFKQEGVEVPSSWSQMATNVVVSKYFRGAVGAPGREWSVKQLLSRVVDTIAQWGRAGGYFATDEDAAAFQAELMHLVLQQKMSFNSPVWFNFGVEPRPQGSACFINSITDTMESIMDLARTEALLFKYGSGTGTNLSALRSSKERLSTGGVASGPVSFMKGFDAFAGVIKSGGKTRRAAKMVILDVDHPDIVEFVKCKEHEEKKAWALIDAGYDGSLNGEAYSSVYFQNSNNSVRIPDAFMEAYLAGKDWETKARTDGRVMERIPARKLVRQIAEAAHASGDPGLQFDTTIQEWNPCSKSDRINATNPCSEFVFLDDTACNLASLNLMRFRKPDGEFDVAAFRHACAVTILAQEIIVDNASYPRERIAERSHSFRPLGLGYANLGALLMARGIPYDSDQGRSITSAITATLTGEAYRTSALVAEALGPFSGYAENREPFQRVMRKHRDAVAGVDARQVPADLMEAARKTWDDVVEFSERYGVKNAQATVIAPTGTIAFMMDCDTTGVEPDIALVKYKRLVGGGVLKIVNRTVPEALQRLGYSAETVAAILGHIEQKGTIEGAPGLRPEHLPVFDCAFKPAGGVRVVSPMGHVRMVAAVQPFVSGSISKTINVPNEFTVAEVEGIYVQSWRLGLKCIALYRDGCKRTQPLSTSLESTSRTTTGGNGKTDAAPAPVPVAESPAPPPPAPVPAADARPTPVRRRLQDERRSITHKFSVGGHEGYITVGMYEDGTPGEIFITMAKEGSVVSGLMDTVATSSSIALQYGVPLRVLVNKFTHTRFEPAGLTNNAKIPIAKSVIDYVFRWLELKFLAPEGEAASHAEPSPTVPPVPAVEVAAGTIAEEDEAALAATAVKAVEGKVFKAQSDSPPCPDCGSIMVRSGACYRCLNCGAQNGCS
ncbi:MAG: vitamin B12-dependent ribonucleotide reductase [Planctomycetales bacterium]|nr:vitamin B12-dependent ribonucleotide reductase [Planctomycetales bacterium]